MKQLSKLPQKKVWNKKEEMAFQQRNQSDSRGCCWLPIVATNSYKGTNQIHLKLPPTKIFWEVPVFYQHFIAFQDLFIRASSVSLPLPFFCMSSKKCCWDEVIIVFSRTLTSLTLDLCLTDFGHQYVTNLKKIKRSFCLHHHDQLDCYIFVSCVVPLIII